MRDGSHFKRVIASSLAASLLIGCPVDERTLQGAEADDGGEAAMTAGAAGESGAGNAGAGEGGNSSAGRSGDDGGGEPGHAGSPASGGAEATGGSGGISGSSASGGSGGEPPTACVGAKCSCFGERGDECRERSCCDSPIVAGSDFSLGDEAEEVVNATVAEHRLDRYEVTVGRFREFVESYTGAPHPESGQHPWVVASGWRSDWDANMPPDAAALIEALACGSGASFAVTPGEIDARPVNCVTWFEAFAFCAWDGARLPTEAEWEHAASGGALDRSYPWGEEAPVATKALFDASELELVGSKPGGAGLYQQLDLAGSVSEWVFDWFGVYADPCMNCALADGGSERVVRGGSYRTDDPLELRASARASAAPDMRSPSFGFRCARDL